MLDVKFVVYTVAGLVGNVILLLWIVARLASQVRLLVSRIDSLERELKLLDESTHELEEQLVAHASERAAAFAREGAAHEASVTGATPSRSK